MRKSRFRLVTIFTLLLAATSLSACCGGPFHSFCGGHGGHGGGGGGYGGGPGQGHP